MESYNCSLNIHYSAPQKYWDKLSELYEKMPGWSGYKDNVSTWYGEDSRIIEVSIEPSGLSFYARLSREEWDEWFSLFKREATKIMGYPVGEPEDGFDFVYFD